MKIKFLLLILLLNFGWTYGQEAPQDSVAITPIGTSYITQQAKEVQDRLKDIRTVINKTEILDPEFELALRVKDTINAFVNTYLDTVNNVGGYANQESAVAFLSANKNALSKIQEKTLSQLESLDTQEDELEHHFNVWKLTKDSLSQNTAEAIVFRVDTTLLLLQEQNNHLKTRQNDILTYLEGMSKTSSLIDAQLEIIEEANKKRAISIFVKEAPNFLELRYVERDTVGLYTQLKIALVRDFESTKTYFTFNGSKLMYHVLLVLIIYVLMGFLGKHLDEVKEFKALLSNFNVKLFYRYKMASAFLVFSLMFNWLYVDCPNSVRSIYMLVLLLPLFLLMKSLTFKYSTWLTVAFILLILLDFAIAHVNPVFLESRILMLVISGIVLGMGVVGGKVKRALKDQMALGWMQLFTFANFLLIVGAVASIVLNGLGYALFSLHVLSGAIGSVGVMVLILVVFKILESILILATYVLPLSGIAFVGNNRKTVLLFIHKSLNVIISLLIIKGVLTQFDIYEDVVAYLDAILNREWVFGTVTISVMAVVSFFIMVIGSFYIGKLVRYLLEEEVMQRLKIKASLSNSISTTVYYVIITLGIFLAVFGFGINWDDVSLIFSALGVGIGFGLQGIIMNFISGLVITYERPLKVGDTIEVGTLIGDVTEIGVRSSKIKTFTGAEVVVPNGDLISKELINWTLSDKLKRQELRFKTSYNQDPELVISIMKAEAMKNENVLPEPNPLGLFEGFGDSALEFRLLFWTPFGVGMGTKSNLAIAIYKAFQEQNVEVPIPKQEITVKKLD